MIWGISFPAPALNIFFTGHGVSPGGRSVEGGSCFFSLFLFAQEVSLLHVTQVLLDREEDAKNVCRLDQLADKLTDSILVVV